MTVTTEGTEFSLKLPKDGVALEGSESFSLTAECSLADRCFVSDTKVTIIDADGMCTKITCTNEHDPLYSVTVAVVSFCNSDCQGREGEDLQICSQQHDAVIAHGLTLKLTPMTYVEANYSHQDTPAASGLIGWDK